MVLKMPSCSPSDEMSRHRGVRILSLILGSVVLIGVPPPSSAVRDEPPLQQKVPVRRMHRDKAPGRFRAFSSTVQLHTAP